MLIRLNKKSRKFLLKKKKKKKILKANGKSIPQTGSLRWRRKQAQMLLNLALEVPSFTFEVAENVSLIRVLGMGCIDTFSDLKLRYHGGKRSGGIRAGGSVK